MSAHNGLRIVVARTAAEVDELRAAWERLEPRHLNADPDHFAAVLEGRGEAVRPHVVLAERDGEPEALAVARIEDLELEARLGYRSVFRPRVRTITLVYGGLVGDPEGEASAEVLAELRAALARREADALRMRGVRVDSALRAAAERSTSFLRRQHAASTTAHWQLTLPPSYEEFLAGRSKSTRESVKRYGKKLVKELGDRAEVRVIRDEAEIDVLFRDVERVTAQTYQKGLGASFADTPQYRALTRTAMRNGWFRAYFLDVDGAPVAFWHGMNYRGVFSIGVPGYDPAFSELRVGTFLLMRMIEDFCADREVGVLDYGFGDAEYKRRFGDERWEETDVLLFARRPRPVAVNWIRSTLFGLDKAARRLLERRGAFGRVRKRARVRLGGSK